MSGYRVSGTGYLVRVLQTEDFDPELVFSHPSRVATLLGRDVVLPATLPVLVVTAWAEVKPERGLRQLKDGSTGPGCSLLRSCQQLNRSNFFNVKFLRMLIIKFQTLRIFKKASEPRICCLSEFHKLF